MLGNKAGAGQGRAGRQTSAKEEGSCEGIRVGPSVGAGAGARAGRAVREQKAAKSRCTQT